MPRTHMALLAFIIILTLWTVVSIANNRRFFADITTVIFMEGLYGVKLFAEFWLCAFFGAYGKSFCACDFRIADAVLALGDCSIVEEITAKLIDCIFCYSWGQAFLPVRLAVSQLEGYHVLEKFYNIAASFYHPLVPAEGTALTLSLITMALKSFTLSQCVTASKSWRAYPFAIFPIRPSGAISNDGLWASVGDCFW